MGQIQSKCTDFSYKDLKLSPAYYQKIREDPERSLIFGSFDNNVSIVLEVENKYARPLFTTMKSTIGWYLGNPSSVALNEILQNIKLLNHNCSIEYVEIVKQQFRSMIERDGYDAATTVDEFVDRLYNDLCKIDIWSCQQNYDCVQNTLFGSDIYRVNIVLINAGVTPCITRIKVRVVDETNYIEAVAKDIGMMTLMSQPQDHYLLIYVCKKGNQHYLIFHEHSSQNDIFHAMSHQLLSSFKTGANNSTSPASLTSQGILYDGQLSSPGQSVCSKRDIESDVLHHDGLDECACLGHPD